MTLLQALARTSAPEAAVWLRVEDQGPGIEREHLPRLGERFYRADQSRGGKITGTSLGLAIVKHIMAHHRGGLAVETLMGQGTAFGVWIARWFLGRIEQSEIRYRETRRPCTTCREALLDRPPRCSGARRVGFDAFKLLQMRRRLPICDVDARQLDVFNPSQRHCGRDTKGN